MSSGIFIPEMPQLNGLEDLEDHLQAVSEWGGSVTDKLNGGLSLGDPTHPQSGSEFPNGLRGNLASSYVVNSVTAAGTAVDYTHNLDIGVGAANALNVFWFAGFKHSGVGASSISAMSLDFQVGDTVGADSVQLRLRAPNRTVNVANPVVVCVMFYGVTGW